MGIKNLNKFLRKECPDIYEEIHISQYAYKKVAIDISLYLCKYKSIAGNNWISCFIDLVMCLRKYEVHCVFCFDTGAPIEKANERKKRKDSRDKIKNNIIVLEKALNKYKQTSILDDILLQFYKKKQSHQNNVYRRFLGERKTTNQNYIDINFVEFSIEKMKSQLLNITPNDFKLTRDLFDLMNVPYYNAILEGETLCSDLCIQGIVDTVLTEDSDVLAYSCPTYLSKLNTRNGNCILIRYDNVLNKLGLTQSEFLDFCIMSGTDYNSNIPRIGSTKAYKYIKQYSTIENIHKQLNLDISVLNHKRSRELFTQYEKSNIFVPFCGKPNFKRLLKFMENHNLDYNMNLLENIFTKNNNIIFS